MTDDFEEMVRSWIIREHDVPSGTTIGVTQIEVTQFGGEYLVIIQRPDAELPQIIKVEAGTFVGELEEYAVNRQFIPKG